MASKRSSRKAAKKVREKISKKLPLATMPLVRRCRWDGNNGQNARISVSVGADVDAAEVAVIAV